MWTQLSVFAWMADVSPRTPIRVHASSGRDTNGVNQCGPQIQGGQKRVCQMQFGGQRIPHPLGNDCNHIGLPDAPSCCVSAHVWRGRRSFEGLCTWRTLAARPPGLMGWGHSFQGVLDHLQISFRGLLPAFPQLKTDPAIDLACRRLQIYWVDMQMRGKPPEDQGPCWAQQRARKCP